MDKIMRLHSITNTIENGLVYLPTEAGWLAPYLQELTTFPNGRHDDQADSTSQALDWMKQTTCRYGLFEYQRQEALRQRLGLSLDYRFIQCDEDEEIVAVHKTTGETLRWPPEHIQAGLLRCSGEPPLDVCPSCLSKGVATYAETQRCNQCGNFWRYRQLIY